MTDERATVAPDTAVTLKAERLPIDLGKTLILLLGLGVFLAVYFSPSWGIAIDLNPVETGGAIARLGLLVSGAGLALFFYRVFHPKRGVLAHQQMQHKAGAFVSANKLWLPLLSAFPLFMAALAPIGYTYSAKTLSETFLFSLWMTIGLVIVHALVLRWLLDNGVGLAMAWQAGVVGFIGALAWLASFFLRRPRPATELPGRVAYWRDRAEAIREHVLEHAWNPAVGAFTSGYGSSSRVYEKADRCLGMTPGAYRNGGRGQRLEFAVVQTAMGVLLLAATAKGISAVKLGDQSAPLLDELRREFVNAELVEAGPQLPNEQLRNLPDLGSRRGREEVRASLRLGRVEMPGHDIDLVPGMKQDIAREVQVVQP